MFQDEIDAIIKKNKVLIDKAIYIMEKVPDAMHSVSHMESVVKYTIEILKYEEKANKEVCIISAYWHDVGRSVQNKDHAIISADMLKEEMQKQQYDNDMIESCYQAIYKHSWYDIPDTLEGIIVRDADKIDFIGIGRWKQCINANHRCESILELLPTLRSNLLQLDCSRKIYDEEVAKLIGYLHDLVFSANKEIRKI